MLKHSKKKINWKSRIKRSRNFESFKTRRKWRTRINWRTFSRKIKNNELKNEIDDIKIWEEKVKRNDRIIVIEHVNFTPLVMSATVAYRCYRFQYTSTIAWIGRKITFLLIKSIGICLRGSRSVFCSDSLEQSLSRDAYASESVSNFWFHIIYCSIIVSYKM